MSKRSERRRRSLGDNDKILWQTLQAVTVRHPNRHVAFNALEQCIEMLVALLADRDGGLSEFSVVARLDLSSEVTCCFLVGKQDKRVSQSWMLPNKVLARTCRP